MRVLPRLSLHLKKRRMSSLVKDQTLDASAVLKWFKKKEEHGAEALILRDKIPWISIQGVYL